MPDREPVGAQLARAGTGAALDDLERGVRVPSSPTLNDGAQRVEPGRPQPLRAPARQVAAGGLGERAEQVVERRVAVGVAREVEPQARQELVLPDVGDQLLEDARALGVGDAVEVDLDGLQVGDVRGDGVGRGQLVLAVGPRLLDVGERRPRVAVLGGLGLADDARPGGERLVEPQVVPPAHGHEVAEPHVRHLVQHGLGAALVEVAGDAAAEDVVLEERHGADVLHRAGVELGDEELVVLPEGVGHPEVAVVEAEALLGLGEQPVGVHVLGEARAAEDAERDGAVLVGVGVVPARVRPGDQRDEVGRDARGGGERVPLGAVVGVGDGLGGAVGDHLPARAARSPSR